MFSSVHDYAASHFETLPGVDHGMDADEFLVSLGFKQLVYLDKLPNEVTQLDCNFHVPSIQREVVDLHPKGIMR